MPGQTGKRGFRFAGGRFRSDAGRRTFQIPFLSVAARPVRQFIKIQSLLHLAALVGQREGSVAVMLLDNEGIHCFAIRARAAGYYLNLMRPGSLVDDDLVGLIVFDVCFDDKNAATTQLVLDDQTLPVAGSGHIDCGACVNRKLCDMVSSLGFPIVCWLHKPLRTVCHL